MHYSDCLPDRSDRNVLEGNDIAETTAESVDIKEGTTGGTVRGNTFSGVGMSAADAWVDVKGNEWQIVGNVGADAPEDGFQTHSHPRRLGCPQHLRRQPGHRERPRLRQSTSPRTRTTTTSPARTPPVAAAEGLSTITCS